MCCCVIDLYFLLKETARPPSLEFSFTFFAVSVRSRPVLACCSVFCVFRVPFLKLKVLISDLHHFLACDAVGHAVCAWACRLGSAPDPKKTATDWDHMVHAGTMHGTGTMHSIQADSGDIHGGHGLNGVRTPLGR